MSTIRKQLVNGYILNTDGEWKQTDTTRRVTKGGNVDVRKMQKSLELPNLLALADKRGVTLDQLISEVTEAAMFVGGYLALVRHHQVREAGEDPDDHALYVNEREEDPANFDSSIRSVIHESEITSRPAQ